MTLRLTFSTKTRGAMTRAVCRGHVHRLSKVAAVLAAFSVLGCGGGASSPPAKQTATAAVTPEAGGTVKLPDDSVQLNVPPGAVPANTMITMTTTDAPAPQGITAVSPIMQFAPDGTVFQKPVTVTFTFKNATNPVVFWSNSTGGYDLIEGTVTGSTIAAPVMHFSTGFVGERPAGSSDTCGDGVPCTAGMTCGFGGGGNTGTTNGTGATNGTGPSSGGGTISGGGTMAGGNASHDGGAMTAPPNTDPGSNTGAAATGGGSSGGTMFGTMGGAADASVGAMPIDPGSMKPAATSALSSSTPSSAPVCCSCGADGVFHCSLCQGSTDTGGPNAGADGGITASPCVQGGSCSSPGSGCGMGPSGGGGGPAGGGSTSTGAPMSGAAAPDSTGAGQAGTGSSTPTGGICCTCGTDGTYHCTSPCTQPMGSVDASAGGGTFGGGSDGGTMAGGPAGQCVQGAACHPGGPACQDASPISCTMCLCGADGTLTCAPCDMKVMGADAGIGGTGGPASMCVPGAACAAGMPMCRDASTMSCSVCACGADGTLACQPCPGAGADGGTQTPPADGGVAAGGPTGCMPGAQCAVGSPDCQNVRQGGACYACQCVDPGMLKCSPCDGGAAPPPSDAAAPVDPTCSQGLACPQVGAACGSGPVNGVCTKCMCGADGTYACQQMAC
jgi:hypothetical protein